MLWCLGVPEEWFIEKQAKAIKAFNVDFMEEKIIKGSLDLGTANQVRTIGRVLKQMSRRKTDVSKEPLMKTLLHGIKLNSYLGINRRGRTVVFDSCTLIGVVDSEGILEEGEIFVQIRRDNFKC